MASTDDGVMQTAGGPRSECLRSQRRRAPPAVGATADEGVRVLDVVHEGKADVAADRRRGG